MSDQGPTIFNDRYELHRKLARGGMADVYLARDLLLDRPVAVKVLFPEYAKDDTFVERFRREAKSAAGLNHPNVVAVYDWGEQGDTYFIVMEYVEGRSLSDIIRSDGPLHPRRVAEIAADTAAALGFAHRNGVVHRDIKPGNIMISPSGQVKVADFGIAQAVTGGAQEANLTQVGSVMGTATYFSPEQAQGKPVDPRSDLYSLGCVMFEMLTSRAPFTGESPVAIAYQHVQEPTPRLGSTGVAVPAPLEAIVLHLLAKKPEDRYASAEDLRADLRNYLQDLPVSALRSGAALAAGLGTAAAASSVAGGAPVGATRVVPVVEPPVMAPVGPPTGPVAATAYRPEEPRRGNGFLWGILAILVILAGLLFFLFTQLNPSGAKQVQVPTVTQQTLDVARSTLEQAGFVVSVQNEANADTPQGTVFDQSPAGGEQADKGSTVVIKVSAGVGQTDVKSVVGLSKAAATSLLENSGFVVNETDQNDAKVPAGQVISQSPAGGQKADKGSVVNIVVSTGPAAVTIPDVSGQSAAAAASALTSAGFKVSETQEPSTSVAAGKVIGTKPDAGTEQPPGTTVTIVISTGPPATTTAPTTTEAPTTTKKPPKTTTTVPP